MKPFFRVVALAVAMAAPVLPAEPRPDPGLERSLRGVLQRMQLAGAVSEHRLAVSLIDLSDPAAPVYAGVNDHDMMYAASLPKIVILLAGFERIRAGLMEYNPAVKEMFTRLARFSSNADASRAVQAIGFEYIARILTSAKYRLYDPERNGGLWLGKAYGGPNDFWKRDPLHNLSHGATSFQVARFFHMLDQGRLVSPRWSAEIKEILSNPGIRHKFVKGLADRPGHVVYRKSGTWKDAHCDAALVEFGGHKYVAVALMKDPKGGDVLPRLIQHLDDLVCDRTPGLASD
ncbi:MAG: serine hydrolase [Bryobacterales bacterium]|nr:serine hydrolase [Bryobacterales bacterium]